MSKFNFIIFILNFLLITSQNINDNEQINNIINCVNSTIINDETIKTTLLESYEKKDNSFFRLIGEFLITKPNEMKKCIPNKQIELNNNNEQNSFNDILKNKYNWNEFVNCLKEKIGTNAINGEINDHSIIDLIQEIKKENYVLAIKEQFRLRRYGNIIINECNTKLINHV